MSSVNEIRSTFLDFFRDRGHEVVPSSPLVPRNDPTLMFTNAGMVQFKNVFTGVEKRALFARRHGAEMRARRRQAQRPRQCRLYGAPPHLLRDAGQLLLRRLFQAARDRARLDADHQGIRPQPGPPAGHRLSRRRRGLRPVEEDRRASGRPHHPHRLVGQFLGDGRDGAVRPLFRDLLRPGREPVRRAARQRRPGRRPVPRILEPRLHAIRAGRPAATASPLPRPSIDTGMGLERMAAILQGVKSNYDTDLMREPDPGGRLATGVDPDGPQAASHRIIADHLRACAFLVADGVDPSNEGRGYVLRRIMRRAMRHAQLLGAREPLMWRLVPALVREMGQAYPELVQARRASPRSCSSEETRFRGRWRAGLPSLTTRRAPCRRAARLPGDVAFKLYDTFGFPLDLTQDALRGRGMSVDDAGFAARMERQRAEARKAWAGSGEAATETVWYGLRERTGATEFLGYSTERRRRHRDGAVAEGGEVDVFAGGRERAGPAQPDAVLRRVGGQVGDTGTMSAPGVLVRVTDTQKKLGDVFVHEVTVEEGKLRGAWPSKPRWTMPPRPPSGPIIRRRTSCMRRCGRCLGRMWPRRAPRRSRAPALRFFPSEADHRRRTRRGGRDRQRRRAAERARGDPADGDRRGARERRPRAVRRKIRRRGPGRLHGSAAGRGAPRALFDRALRRHPCGADRRYRPDQRRGRKRGRRRRPPHRGADRRSWRAATSTRKAHACAISRHCSRRRRSRRPSARGAGRGAPAARARTRRGAQEAGAWAAAAERQAPARSAVAGVNFSPAWSPASTCKDLKGLADEAKKSVGSGVVAIVGVGPTARPASWSRSRLTSRTASTRWISSGSAAESSGGKGGGGRPDMAQAGGPDGAAAEAALDAVANAPCRLFRPPPPNNHLRSRRAGTNHAVRPLENR